MVEVNVDIEIDAKPDHVFTFISNFENNPIWQKGMVSCTYTNKTNEIIGSKYDQLAKFLGRDIVTSFEVTEYEPMKLIKASSTAGSFPITFTRWVEHQGDKTRVKATIQGDSSGFFKILNPFMQFMVNRSINKDYKRLKEYFESDISSSAT